MGLSPPSPSPPDGSLALACINCGYSQQGLPGAEACPECGSRRSLPPGSEAWVRSARAGLTALAWTIPLSLLAWASPVIAHTTSPSGTSSLISDRSWFLIVAMIAATAAVRTLSACTAPLAASRWSFRLAAVLTIALAVRASDVLDGGGALLMLLLSPTNWTIHILIGWVLSVLFAVWLIPTVRMLGVILQTIGLARSAVRLRRWSVPLAICLLVANTWHTWAYHVFDAIYHHSSSSDEALNAFASRVYESMNLCNQIDTLATTLLAALGWYTVLQARHQMGMLAAASSARP